MSLARRALRSNSAVAALWATRSVPSTTITSHSRAISEYTATAAESSSSCSPEARISRQRSRETAPRHRESGRSKVRFMSCSTGSSSGEVPSNTGRKKPRASVRLNMVSVSPSATSVLPLCGVMAEM